MDNALVITVWDAKNLKWLETVEFEKMPKPSVGATAYASVALKYAHRGEEVEVEQRYGPSIESIKRDLKIPAGVPKKVA
jgi:hypothetical protein